MNTTRLLNLVAGVIGLTMSVVAEEPARRSLVIGKVSDNPRKHFWYLKPIADYAVEHMSDLGITEARVLMAKDNETMIRYLRQGKVDWVTETPFSALQFVDKADARIILRRWKKDAPEYHALFFTRRDSGVASLADLRGRRVALEDPGSTSAFFLPLLILMREGLSPVKLDSIDAPPPPDRVGYIFIGQEINIATWVHEGRVDAGGFNDHDWRKSDHTPPAYKDELHVLYRGKPYVRAIELVRDGLGLAVRERLVEVLLHAHEDPRARRALDAYQRTTRFGTIDDEATEDLEELRRMIDLYSAKLQGDE